MKKLFLFIALFCLGQSFGWAEPVKPDFKLHKVTVYLVGAELNYKAKLNIPRGRTTLIFGNVSQALVDNSARVKMDNGVKIISVSLETVKVNYEKEMKVKQDSLELITGQMARIRMEKNSYAIERKILTDNITRIGSNDNVPTSELMNATKLFREKLKELDNIDYQLQKREEELLAESNRLAEDKTRLLQQQSVSESGSRVKQLVIEVEAKSETSSQIDMSYLVSDAGWSPKYNIRAVSDAAEIGLEYRAYVYNNSGILWKNVNVALSTASTETKLIKPELGYAWQLDFNGNNQQNTKTGTVGEGNFSNKQLKNTNVEFVNIEAPELDVYMNLDVPYDIPTDNLPHMVSVGDFKLPVSYKYYSVPKVDDNVYLIAYVNGWQKLNLIEGESSIYVNEAFLGNSYLNTKFSDAALEVSLGTEKNIQLTRVKKEDKESAKTIGTNRHVKLAYDIDVRNLKNKDIEIEITDQVPVSGDSDIEVEILQTSGATPDEQSGKLVWNLNLKPNETKKLVVEFNVKYPKNKHRSISFTLFRSGRQKVACPKFR